MGKRNQALQPSRPHGKPHQNLRSRSIEQNIPPNLNTHPSNNLILGGWDPYNAASVSISSNLDAEIDQAFSNVDLALREAGGKGWSQVISVRSYHIPVDDKATDAMVRNLKHWCGEGQRPIWTELGVTTLGAEGMRVEIEVEAWAE